MTSEIVTGKRAVVDPKVTPLREESTLRPIIDRSPAAGLLPGADERFRAIYTRLGNTPPRALVVSSAIAGEGKTTVALGLATTIAHDRPDLRVCLLETDLWQPVLASDLGVPPEPGLSEVLRDRATVEAAMRGVTLENLVVVPGGGVAPGPQALLRSSRMREVLDELRLSCDVVVIDAPAVLVHSETVAVSDLADAVIFVVRAGVTPSPQVFSALALLDKASGGIVLNGTGSKIPRWLQRIVES
jgi:capsular exopolysaccharide synthesis family protein